MKVKWHVIWIIQTRRRKLISFQKILAQPSLRKITLNEIGGDIQIISEERWRKFEKRYLSETRLISVVDSISLIKFRIKCERKSSTKLN